MQTQITARHFEADPTLKDYAESRLEKLERYYDGITEVRVVLSEDGAPGKSKSAEVFVNVYQQVLSAASTGSTHESAIDQCMKALRRQLKRYKAKLRATDKDYQR